MTRKIIAALTALILCLGLTACGKENAADESSSQAETSASSAAESEGSEAEESKADTAEDKSADSETESSAESKAGKNDGADGSSAGSNAPDGVNITLNAGNIIFIDQGELEQKPTDEELAKMMEVAMAYYRAAEKKDKQAFFGLMDFGLIRDMFIDLAIEGRDIESGEELDAFMAGWETKYEIMDDISDLLSDIGDQDIMMEIWDTEDPSPDEMRRMMNAIFDSVGADKDIDEDDLYYYTIWDSDLAPMPEMSDSTTYAVIVNQYETYGNEMYCRLEIMVVDGSFEYYMDGVDIWCVDGKYGILAESAGYFESDELAGMTAQDIYDEMMNGMTEQDIKM